MPRLRSTSCCGMKELYIGETGGYFNREHPKPEVTISFVCKKSLRRWYNYNDPRLGLGYVTTFKPNFSHVVFTENRRRAYGTKLAAYITTNRLGKVTISTTGRNPNTGRPITVFVWTLNQANLKKWFAKFQKKEK